MPELTREERVVVYLLVGLLAMGSIFMLWQHREDFLNLVVRKETATVEKAEEKSPVPEVRPVTEEPRIIVHVAGAVKVPGVYRLPKGARVVDAVGAAGGETEVGQVGVLNLAALLQDGQKIYVPSAQEVSARTAGGASLGTGGAEPGGRKVNLNLASQAQLEGIPGIGPVMAQKIILFREKQGPFRRLEDLLKVSGIGEKKLEELRYWVSVE